MLSRTAAIPTQTTTKNPLKTEAKKAKNTKQMPVAIRLIVAGMAARKLHHCRAVHFCFQTDLEGVGARVIAVRFKDMSVPVPLQLWDAPSDEPNEDLTP